MTDNELIEIAVKALDSKKASDIKCIKIKDLTIIGNYFLIATGSSTTQVKALADEVEFQLSQKGLEPHGSEGFSTANWIVLDYIDVVIHVFYKETREFYDLERLWQDGEMIDISGFTKEN